MPGFLALLIAKLAGLGAVAKLAIASTTAAVTMAVGAGAGVLPLPDGSSHPAVVAQGAIDQAAAAVGSAVSSLPPTTSGAIGVQAAGGASVTSPIGSTSAKANTGVATPPVAAPAVRPTVANVTPPSIPALPAIPSCVANLVPTGGAVPDPARLVAQLPACVQSVVTANLPLDTIQSVIGSTNLPLDVVKCLSSVLRLVPGFVGGNLSGLSQLLTACLPKGSIPGTGSIPGFGSIR